MEISIKDYFEKFAQDFDEKTEWEKYIQSLSIHGVDESDIDMLLEELALEPDEISGEFKDRVLDVAEHGHTKKKIEEPTNEEVELIDFQKGDQDPPKVNIPKIKAPTVKQPGTTRLFLQDDSLGELSNLLQVGYDTVQWILNETHKIYDICDELNNYTWSLEEFISGLQHNAPIFEKSHPGCKCLLRITSNSNSELAEMIIGSGDRWAFISVKDRLQKIANGNNLYIHFDKENTIDVDHKLYAIPYDVIIESKYKYNQKAFEDMIENFKRQYGENIFLVRGTEVKNQSGFDVINVLDVINQSENIEDLIQSIDTYVEKNGLNIKDEQIVLGAKEYSHNKLEQKKQSSIIDYPHESLPDDLWEKDENTFKLKENVKKTIVDIVDKVLDEKFNEKDNWFDSLLFEGSAGSQFWKLDTDLDLKIMIDVDQFLKDNPEYQNLFEQDFADFQKELVKIVREDEYNIGNRPIDLYVLDRNLLSQDFFFDRADNIYDILHDEWLKEPFLMSIDEYDRTKVIGDAQEEALHWAQKWDLDKGAILRSVKEYELIKDHIRLLPDEKKKKFLEDINKLIVDVENEIETMWDEIEVVNEDRHLVFDEPFESNIEVYMTSLNWTKPNLVFKLLQRWGYHKLIYDLGEFLEDDGVITEDELPEVKKIIQENFISVKDKSIKIATINEITKEMEDFYNKRTNEHIQRVQKNMEIFANELNEYDEKEILERAKEHDKSKFEEPERTPYIFITWDYKCKDNGEDCEISEDIKNKMNEASNKHCLTNKHHPEYHSSQEDELINREDRDKPPKEIIDATSMGDIDIIELVSDWYAMSEENGTDVNDWADKNIDVRWKFESKHKDMIYI